MFSFTQRMGYGVGGAVFAIKEAAYAVFILLFYTQVLGLSGSATGVVLFLAVIWDAINDPMIGAWSDRTRSRWGRRHPFMLAGGIPMGVGFLGLFSPPDMVLDSQWLLGGWLLFWSIWIRTFLTFFTIPHMALAAEITSDYHDRSQLLGARTAFGFLGAVLLPAAGMYFLFQEQGGIDGRFQAANYPTYGLWSCLLVWLFASVAILSTRRYIPQINHAEHRLPSSTGILGLFEDFFLVLRNANFRTILFYDIAASTSYGILISLNIMAWTYYWELSATEVSIILGVPSLIGVPMAVALMGPLGRRWSKQKILQIAIALMILDAAWVFPLRMYDLIPANGHWLVFALLFAQMFIWMFLFALRVISAFSIIADVTDEHELNHGVRQEGGFYAAMNFTTKLAGALGPLYAGLVLDLIDLKEGILPGNVGAGTLDGLALFLALGVIPPMLVAWRFTFRITMSQERLAQVQAELKARADQLAANKEVI